MKNEVETGTKATLVSKAEYARMRGVTGAMVTYWVRKGTAVIVDGKVDVAATDALVAGGTDPTRGRSPGRGRKSPAPEQAPQAAIAAFPATENAMSRATARDRDLSADLKALKLSKEAGRLVDRVAFERVVEETFAGLRDSLLTVPVKLADALAAEPNARRCMDMVRQAIEKALNDRADLEEALAEKAGATSQ